VSLQPSPAAPEDVPRAGLTLPRDILINPRRAFAKIAARHEWFAACAVIALLSLATAFLIAPALIHVASIAPPPPGGNAPKTPDAIAAARQGLMGELALREVMTPLLVVLLTASACTTFARFKAQTTSIVTFIALAANCMIPLAIGELVTGLAIRAHNPASYSDLHALIVALPLNLAVFANPSNESEVGFLARFDLFTVWSSVLLAYGVEALVKVKFTTALVFAFGLAFLFAVLF